MLAISNQLGIDSQRVLHDVGYQPNDKAPARMLSLIEDYIENAKYLMAPSYSGVIREVTSVKGSLVFIEGFAVFESEVLARMLVHCRKAAVFALTIGGYLEETVSQLAEDGRVVQAAVLDAIGTAAVESVADFVQGTIREKARSQGLYISQRFSPGYCDWDVSQQREVFQVIDGESAGVRLTEGCLMLPRKSISGIIGIGPREVENYNPCPTCDKLDCVGRR